MPYTVSNPPAAAKGLLRHAIEIFVAAFNAALKEYDGNEGRAFATAWAAVRQKYEKDDKGEWHEKQRGGPGSGNFGHEGRPGEVGGSGPGGGVGAMAGIVTQQRHKGWEKNCHLAYCRPQK